MAGEEAAKAALRTAQNAVLGKGKRARGVTVTRSSQEELMKAVSLVLSPVCYKKLNFVCSYFLLGEVALMDPDLL
jgi:site-specific recombinase XerC